MAKRRAKRRLRLSTECRQRLRREFVPRDFRHALQSLEGLDRRVILRVGQERVVRAVVTLAGGGKSGLARAIQAANEDCRDVLGRTEDEFGTPLRLVTSCLPDLSPVNPEEEAFLAALLEQPADNLTRLVYADWLDERNDSRGPYLRTLCEWVQSRRWADEELFAREESLRASFGCGWHLRVRGIPVVYQQIGKAGAEWLDRAGNPFLPATVYTKTAQGGKWGVPWP